jgi:hypothetical protein
VPRFVVEAAFSGVGQLTPEELRTVTGRLERASSELGDVVQWQHAYVTAERLHLVYVADDEARIRQHLERVGVRLVHVTEVAAAIDPTSDPTSAPTIEEHLP